MSTSTKKNDTVTNRDGVVYQINELLGESDKFRIYGITSDKYPDNSLILKISTQKEHNHLLEHEAFLLTQMSEVAEEIDVTYAKEHSGTKLNYQMGFPKLIDNFISEEQKNRRILILSLEISKDISKIVPINFIRAVDKVRVDPKTSVWILGKLLKIIAFAHDHCIKVGNLSGENIFIEKNNHLVTIFDWSKAIMKPVALSKDMAIDEIRQAVKETLLLLGGDSETGTIPDHEQLTGDGVKYKTLLMNLLIEDFESAYDAHHYFYKTVEEIWERKYHPYSTISI